MKKTREQKGITLIALIITIIILLILAVVTINSIKNDGIIQYAQNARDDYKREQDKESDILDSYLSHINTAIDKKEDDKEQDKEEQEGNEGITTQEAVEQGLKVGDYVSYPVEYTNVGTWVGTSTGEIKGNYPLDTYTGWRVLSIEGTGSDTYLRLVSAGVPLNYYHYDNSTTTVTNLTTGFFNTPINSTVTQYNFYSCGFKDAQGNAITSIDTLKTLFTNKYTQVDATTPKVQSITLDDASEVWGSDVNPGTSVTSNDLLAIPCKAPEDSEYAATWLASACDGYGVWFVYYDGDVYGDGNLTNVLRCASCSFSKV